MLHYIKIRNNMIFSKQAKNMLFKYKYIILLLLVTVFCVIYNNPKKESFNVNQCTSGEELDERTALYCNATEQLATDAKSFAYNIIRNACYADVDRCKTVLTEILTASDEEQQ